MERQQGGCIVGPEHDAKDTNVDQTGTFRDPSRLQASSELCLVDLNIMDIELGLARTQQP